MRQQEGSMVMSPLNEPCAEDNIINSKALSLKKFFSNKSIKVKISKSEIWKFYNIVSSK